MVCECELWMSSGGRSGIFRDALVLRSRVIKGYNLEGRFHILQKPAQAHVEDREGVSEGGLDIDGGGLDRRSQGYWQRNPQCASPFSSRRKGRLAGDPQVAALPERPCLFTALKLLPARRLLPSCCYLERFETTAVVSFHSHLFRVSVVLSVLQRSALRHAFAAGFTLPLLVRLPYTALLCSACSQRPQPALSCACLSVHFRDLFLPISFS